MRIEASGYSKFSADQVEALKQAMADDKQLKKQREREQELKRQEQMAEQLKRETEAAKKRMEDEKNALKTYVTCLEIARRITAGDKVPTKDHKFLLEHDPALYGKALTLRIAKENPEEHKQLSEDEDQQTSSSSETSAGDNEPLQQDISNVAIDIKI